MNLFLIARNLPKERYPMVVSELRRMTEVYPQLDPETLWHRGTTCGTIFTASMHTADQAAAPRRYVMQDDKQVVFYSGLPVNPPSDYLAHRAEVLSAHWDQVIETIEGQYFIVRATDDPSRLELQTDILGYEEVFYFQQGDSWLISNSVQLIERISKPRALDPLGVSLFLSTGWVGSDRTLRCDIRVIPGGQRWTWQGGDIEPTRQTYYPRSRLARQPRQVLTPSYIKQLADDLMQPLRSLSQSFDNTTCSLTGGLDSRLIAAMLIRAGLKAQYYTFGDPSHTDVKIATLIARTFDLPYKVTTITVSDVISDWDNTCWQTIQQADGMRSLYLASGMLKNRASRIDRLDVILWGAGGEIARCFYGSPHFFLARLDVADIERLLVKKRNRDYGGLIRQEGVALVRGYIHRFIMQCADDGFAPIDIPDLFGMYEGDVRRVGNNSRGLMSCRDVFSPYCTRAFVDATFALPALQRYTEPLHYNLMRLLSPKLHSMPSDKGPWPLQQPIMNLLKSYGTAQLARIRRRLPDGLIKANRDKCCSSYIDCDIMLDRKSWFEAKREQLREVCLDQTNSSIWDFVDRSMFDRIMSSATDPVDRSRYLKVLCDIVTLFYYEADHRRYSDSATANPPFES